MSVENISTSCIATASGICAASVAANSEERISPERISVRCSRAVLDCTVANVLPKREITSLCGTSPSASKVLADSSLPSGVTVACTRRPGRRFSSARAAGSDLIKEAACASLTPSRSSSVARLSPERTRSSLTNCCAGLSDAICDATSGKANSSTTIVTGKSDASGASGATPAAPKAIKVSPSAVAEMMRVLREERCVARTTLAMASNLSLISLILMQ